MSWEMQLDEHLLEELYQWIDSLPLTGPKKVIERDFSDGKLVAEIIHYYLPELVDLHNYSSANSLEHKKSNWRTLNKKVLSHFGLDLPDVIITGLSNGKPGLVEVLLFNLRLKINEEFELQEKILEQSYPSSSSRQTFISHSPTSKNSSINISSNRVNQSSFSNKNISHLSYQEVKQQYQEQEQQIQLLEDKLHNLQQILQVKDNRINDLTRILNNNRSMKSKK